jgi:hypothetical protein
MAGISRGVGDRAFPVTGSARSLSSLINGTARAIAPDEIRFVPATADDGLTPTAKRNVQEVEAKRTLEQRPTSYGGSASSR